MPILRAVCPECKAGMKSGSPAGFAEGQTIECPKCGTYFAVEEAPAAKAPAAKPAAKPRPKDDDEDDRPAKKKARRDDDEDDRPAKKKARRDDDEDEDDDEDDRPKKKKKGKKSKDEKSYKSSPVRFIVLGVLVLIMLVGAFFLYQKWEKEKEEANKPVPISNPDEDLTKPIRPDPNARTPRK